MIVTNIGWNNWRQKALPHRDFVGARRAAREPFHRQFPYLPFREFIVNFDRHGVLLERLIGRCGVIIYKHGNGSNARNARAGEPAWRPPLSSLASPLPG